MTTDASDTTPAILPEYGSAMMTLDAVRTRMMELQAFIKGQMIEKEDFGVIPGTQKPTLYKPGAEKLCNFYGLVPRFDFVEKEDDWEAGRFAYVVKCTLTHIRSDQVVSTAIGECNSWEARYRYRWLWPNQVIGAIPADAPKNKRGQIRVINDDPYSLRNTILKMAQKRALVAATLMATRSSGLFTQDLEDLAANGAIDVDYTETPPKSETKAENRKTAPPQSANRKQNTSDPPAANASPKTSRTPRPQPDKGEATQAFLKAWGSVSPMVDHGMFGRSMEVITQGRKIQECDGLTVSQAAQFAKALLAAKEAGWPDADCEKAFHANYPSGGSPSWQDIDKMITGVMALASMPYDVEPPLDTDTLPDTLPF